MARPDELYLDDMIAAIGAIERYLNGLGPESFLESEMIRDAVLLNLIIIGEAAGSLSDAFKKRTPHIDWRAAARFRNRVVHGYFDVIWEIVWDTATRNLPELARAIAAIDMSSG